VRENRATCRQQITTNRSIYQWDLLLTGAPRL